MRKDAKTKNSQTNLEGGGLRLFPKLPPKAPPKIPTLLLDRACRVSIMGLPLSLVSFSLTLSLSETTEGEKCKLLGREDDFMVDVADLCDIPKVRGRILAELSTISPYESRSQLFETIGQRGLRRTSLLCPGSLSSRLIAFTDTVLATDSFKAALLGDNNNRGGPFFKHKSEYI